MVICNLSIEDQSSKTIKPYCARNSRGYHGRQATEHDNLQCWQLHHAMVIQQDTYVDFRQNHREDQQYAGNPDHATCVTAMGTRTQKTHMKYMVPDKFS